MIRLAHAIYYFGKITMILLYLNQKSIIKLTLKNSLTQVVSTIFVIVRISRK